MDYDVLFSLRCGNLGTSVTCTRMTISTALAWSVDRFVHGFMGDKCNYDDIAHLAVMRYGKCLAIITSPLRNIRIQPEWFTKEI